MYLFIHWTILFNEFRTRQELSKTIVPTCNADNVKQNNIWCSKYFNSFLTKYGSVVCA